MRGPGRGRGPGTFILDAEGLLTADDAEEAHLAPVLAPRVPHDPVLLALLGLAPADDGDDVVDLVLVVGGLIKDAAGVVVEEVGVDARGDGSARVHLGHDLLLAAHLAVLGNGRVRERVERRAEAAHVGEGGAGPARVLGLALVPGHVARGAAALGGLGAARLVHQAGLEGHESSLLDKLVGSRRGTPVARSGNLRAAVEDELDGEVDVGTLRVGALRDLDAIGERRHRAVRPARSAVLGHVLIQHLRQVVDALDVRPGEALGKLRRVDVLVGTGADDVLALIVAGHPLERVEHLGLGVRGAEF